MLLDRAKCISILVPTGILILIILCCWFICEARDPSTEKSKDSFSVLSVPRKMTRYCTICCKTSPGLDHHCTWLNTCIADNNYEAFFFLVIAATVETLLQAVVGILMATAWFDEVKLQLSSSWHTPILVLLWVHNAIILSLANSYCLLAGFHIYLVAIRSGTYDFILENGNEGICARMLKCKCLTYSKGRRRRTTRGEKRRSTSKTSPTPTSSKVVAAPRAARGDGPTAHDLVASASKQREVEQWKAEWLRKYGSDDSDKPASAMIQSKAMQTANMSDLKGVHEREHGNSVTNRRETSPDALQTQDEVQIEMGSGIKMSEGGSEDKGKDTPQHREDERSADCCVNPQPPQESPRGVQTEL